LRFFLFCQPENDEQQQEITLKKLLLLAFLVFLAVELRKSAKMVIRAMHTKNSILGRHGLQENRTPRVIDLPQRWSI
jgi:hypothetical protein